MNSTENGTIVLGSQFFYSTLLENVNFLVVIFHWLDYIPSMHLFFEICPTKLIPSCNSLILSVYHPSQLIWDINHFSVDPNVYLFIKFLVYRSVATILIVRATTIYCSHIQCMCAVRHQLYYAVLFARNGVWCTVSE